MILSPFFENLSSSCIIICFGVEPTPLTVDPDPGKNNAIHATDDHVVDESRIVGRVGYSAITGNMLYRSGRPLWSRGQPDASAHLVLRGVRGVTVTANTMVVGRDDENNAGSFGYSTEANWSPDCGIVIERLRNVIIKDNVMDAGAVRELVLDRGGHGEGVLIRDNIGELFKERRT